jgi:hypothetical protein
MILNRLLKILLTSVLGFFLLVSPAVITSSCTPGRSAEMKKAEKERAKKAKQAQKEYDKAVKQHLKNQSDATRKMMKSTKKESPKNTPLKTSSGTKCK